MKCPKCHYLGFETGDRCKNCGYDFSLLGSPIAERAADVEGQSAPAEVGLHANLSVHALTVQGLSVQALSLQALPAGVDRLSLAGPAIDRLADMPLRDARIEDQKSDAGSMRGSGTGRSVADTLPLFTGTSLDDEPLVRFPAPPRPPLAVRRTPDLQRPRPSTVVHRRAQSVPDAPSLDLTGRSDTRTHVDPGAISGRATARAAAVPLEPCSPGARIGAAVLDLAILLAIDLVVVYFTLRMAALTPGDWRLLPPVPLMLFLLLLKVAYTFAFTTIGGQTIGKMAARIRVVSDEGPMITPALAFRRTLGAVASVLTLGSTFLPAIVGRERRALHDRMARTRVVALPVA